MEDCIGGECASPSPTFDPYAGLPNPDDWPEPPEWMFTALYVVIAIMALALVITIFVALATWRRKSVETRGREPQEWVALSEIPTTTRGGVRGVRESAPSHGEDEARDSNSPPRIANDAGASSGDDAGASSGEDVSR